MHSLNNKRYGFTIVELLVVIVVIGILAAISIVSYSGISNQAVQASIKSDLANSATQLELYKIENGSYPSMLDENYCPHSPITDNSKCLKASNGNKLEYIYNSADSSYILRSYILSNLNARYSISSSNNIPTLVGRLDASGGSTLVANGYKIHTFTSNGTFQVTNGGGGYVEVLVVAGGGGGGASSVGSGGGGGGGAGGLIYQLSFIVEQGTDIGVVVGAGGIAGATGNYTVTPTIVATSGLNGSNSLFGSLSAIGGGGGGKDGAVGLSGGSGGGGGYNGYSSPRNGGSATSNQGNIGGATSYFSNLSVNIPPCAVTAYCGAGGAGGGGAGGPGNINSYQHKGGPGGSGLQYSISGSNVTYSIGGNGASGGGSNGAASPANTGKGGDGGYAATLAYAGGSGIVIVRYPY